MARTKLEAFVEQNVQDALDIIDEKLAEVNKKLEVFDRVKEERDKLQAARRALLGVGNKMTGSGGSRITADEVAKWMEDNANGHTDGFTPAEMAKGLSTTDAVVRGHMARGAGERFLKINNKWKLNDPEADAEGEDSDEEE